MNLDWEIRAVIPVTMMLFQPVTFQPTRKLLSKQRLRDNVRITYYVTATLIQRLCDRYLEDL